METETQTKKADNKHGYFIISLRELNDLRKEAIKLSKERHNKIRQRTCIEVPLVVDLDPRFKIGDEYQIRIRHEGD